MNRMLSSVFAGLAAVFAAAAPAAATNVCGMINTNTTWNLAGSPYVLTCDVTIGGGATLTIDPGVVVRFMPGTALEVQTGTLSAIGTGSQPVIFESDDYTDRAFGIRLRPPLGGVANLQRCEFRYLASCIDIQCCWGPNSNIGSANQCDFHNNDTCITGYNGNNFPVSASTFTANVVVATQADKTFTGCTFTNNGTVLQFSERIHVASSAFTGNTVAAWGYRGTIRDSVFMNNGVAVQTIGEGYTLERNIIINNQTGVRLSSASGFVNPMNCNDIYNNSVFDLELTTNFSVNLPNIWWGTMTPSAIDLKIKDGFDDNSLGFVNYTGMLPSNHASQLLCACTAPAATSQPAGANRYQGQSVTFTFGVTATGPINYQWFRNNQPVTNGGRFSGANTASLTINPIARPGADPAWTDGGVYTCTASNLCGSVTSSGAFLNVTWCPADTGDNGVVTVQDIYDYLFNWNSGCP